MSTTPTTPTMSTDIQENYSADVPCKTEQPVTTTATVTATTSDCSSETISTQASSPEHSQALVPMCRPVDDLPVSLTPFSNIHTTVRIRVKHATGYAEFEVHRDLLFHHSPYLKSIFLAKRNFTKSPSPKNKTKITINVKLPDLPSQTHNNIIHTIDLAPHLNASPALFAAYITWLYNGASIIPQLLFPAETFIQLWVLAGKLGTPALQDDCITALEAWRAATGGMVQTRWLGWIYENTQGDCGLRRLLIDQCLWEVPAGWFRKHNELFPDEALVDLAARALELLSPMGGQGPLRGHSSGSSNGSNGSGGRRFEGKNWYWAY
ncbi:hypothetical protein F5884DRAFT_862269 [Xylogone sp. PMI_703]|nr:hypothetical protein F5884DRAFT_862269 [Xylogone sp. PMI_703]